MRFCVAGGRGERGGTGRACEGAERAAIANRCAALEQSTWPRGAELRRLRREIFTCHSVLLTNLIGPPGLLLHALTVQLYAFFRSDDPTARWADPEALRTELEGQQRASDGGG